MSMKLYIGKIYPAFDTMKLKANAAAELTRLAESEIVPILRRQKGFRDETIFIASERAEAISFSLMRGAGKVRDSPSDTKQDVSLL